MDMDALPDDVLRHGILSRLSNFRDVAACSVVCPRWRRRCVPYLPALIFPEGAFGFDEASTERADDTINRMLGVAVKIQDLTIHCPFSPERLSDWVVLRCSTLRALDLQVPTAVTADLECIQNAAAGLEELRLWGATLTTVPAWGGMERLRVLHIGHAVLQDIVALINKIGEACPNLNHLTLEDSMCYGTGEAAVSLSRLKECQIKLDGLQETRSLKLTTPCIESLSVSGFTSIFLQGGTDCLRDLTISNWYVYHVDIGGELPGLEHLLLGGVQWKWEAIMLILQRAVQVKHLEMGVLYFGDDWMQGQPLPPGINPVYFFNTHPRLRKLEIHSMSTVLHG